MCRKFGNATAPPPGNLHPATRPGTPPPPPPTARNAAITPSVRRRNPAPSRRDQSRTNTSESKSSVGNPTARRYACAAGPCSGANRNRPPRSQRSSNRTMRWHSPHSPSNNSTGPAGEGAEDNEITGELPPCAFGPKKKASAAHASPPTPGSTTRRHLCSLLAVRRPESCYFPRIAATAPRPTPATTIRPSL